MYRALIVASGLLAMAKGQLVGTEQTETHPGMTWQSCTAKGSCSSKSGKVVVDANWRWLHVKGGCVCNSRFLFKGN
jgi:cellulose 1,4-beta-cellobiosidase